MRVLLLLAAASLAAAAGQADAEQACNVSWTIDDVAALPADLYETRLTKLGGALYLTGGWEQYSKTQSYHNYVYRSTNRSDSNWEEIIQDGHAPWAARLPLAVPVLNDTLVLVGGVTADECYGDTWFSTNGSTWWPLAQTDAGFRKWRAPGVAVFGGSVIVVGGEDCYGSGSTSSEVYALAWGASEWTRLPDALWASRAAPSVATFDGALWVFGGVNSTDVWRSADPSRAAAWTQMSATGWTCAAGASVLASSSAVFGEILMAPACVTDEVHNFAYAHVSLDGEQWDLACTYGTVGAFSASQAAVTASGVDGQFLWLEGGAAEHVITGVVDVFWSTAAADDDDGGGGDDDVDSDWFLPALIVAVAMAGVLGSTWAWWQRRDASKFADPLVREPLLPQLQSQMALPERYWLIDPGKIRRKEVLGRGATGCVFRATYEGAPAAVKRVMIEGRDDAERRAVEERAVGEAKMLADLTHPYVLRFHGVSVDRAEAAIYFVTELCPRSLQDLIDDPNEPLEPPARHRIAVQIALGFQYLHRCGIIHRDVKPDNILLSAAGDVRIADFGESRIMPRGGGATFTATANVGTLGYMAPELLSDEAASAAVVCGGASDVFGFGIVLNAMATRQRPFQGQVERARHPWVVLDALRRGERPQMSSAPGDAAYNELVQRCWAQDPRARPTFDEIVAVLSPGGRGSVASMRSSLGGTDSPELELEGELEGEALGRGSASAAP